MLIILLPLGPEDPELVVFNKPASLHSNKQRPISLLCLNCWSVLAFIFFICYIYPPFTRKRIAALCFWTVSPHSLESCHFRGFWVTCLPHKDGGVPLSALSKNTTSELAGLFSTTFPKCQAPTKGSCEYHFLKSFGMTRQRD